MWRGTAGRVSAPVEVMMRLSSTSTFFSVALSEPVAMTIAFLAVISGGNLVELDPQPVRFLEARAAFHLFDLILAEQVLDTLREAGDNLVLAGHELREVERHPGDADAMLLRALSDLGEQLSRVEDRLGENASDIEASPTKRFPPLDTGYSHAELRRAVAAGYPPVPPRL